MRTHVSWSLALVALVMCGSLVSGCKSSKHGKSDDGGIIDEEDGGMNPDDGGGPPPGTPGFKLSKQSGLTTDEMGRTDSFTVALNSKPTGDVTLTLSSSDETEGKVSPTTLTFTSLNWNAPQTVTVTGQPDDDADGDQEYSIEFAPAQSSDGSYNGKKPNDVTATNIDDDSAGVSIIGAANLMTSEPNVSTTYRLKLNTEPNADVVITLTSSDTTEDTVAPAVLTFTMDNWNAEQTVTVTGVDDTELDGAQTVHIASAVTSADARYNNIHVDDVVVINKDNETAGFFVVPTSGLRTYEDGRHGDHFTVALNTAPTANVTIMVTSSDLTEATVDKAVLTFTKDNWAAPQRVNVTGVDDMDKDGDQPFTIVLAPANSSDPRYMGADPPDVTGLNVDDESAGFSIDDQDLTATEGGDTASFTLTLNSKPTANVTVGISSNTPAQATVAPASVIFTPDNWNAPQKITITAVDDTLADGPQMVTIALGAAASSDPRYDGLDPPDVIVTINDNDSPGLNVVAADLITTEDGATAHFTVALFSKPSATVTVPLLSKNTLEDTIAPASLTFTVDNWQAPQTVTLTGVDDNLVDGNQVVEIDVGPTTSTDTTYNALSAAPLFVTNIDNDSAGVIVQPTSGLETTESGGQAAFTVSLTKKPTANVVFMLSVTKPGEATITPVTLTFTPDNYNGKQTVTLRGVEDDNVADGDQTYEVVFAPAVSDDASYRGLTPDRVEAINRDNDSPGIVTSVTGGLTTTEAGGTATFTVQLKSKPTQPVTLTLASSRPAEGIVTPVTITFQPENWNGSQSVTLTGQDDQVADGTQPYQVLINSASDDARYAGLTASVDAVNTDNDSAGVTIKLRAGDTLPLITREDGATATFTVVLTSKPTQNVTIPLASTDVGEGKVSPAALTFTPDNWNGDQTVTVTGIGDLLQDGDQQYFITLGPVAGDPTYVALPPISNVQMLNIDTDSAGIFVQAGTLVTSEDGTSATFKISLRHAPTQDVTIPITSSNINEGVVSPGSVTFTSTAYAETTITVTGVDDQVADGRQTYQIVFGPAMSNDPSYAGRVAPALTAYNDDNDSPGITVTPAGGATLPVTTTEGSNATVTLLVSLHSKPNGTITLPVSVSKPSEVNIGPATLTFGPNNWNSQQAVTISSIDDLVQDGNQTYTINIGPATAGANDANYAGLTYPPIDGVNIDNDTAGLDVDPLTPLTTYEDQTQLAATFRVRLRSQPTAPVTLSITSSRTDEGTVSPATLTFTPALTGTAGSYADYQTVTVQGIDDAVADHDQPYTVTIAPDPAGADAVYAALTPVQLSATNVDNDHPGVVVTGTTPTDFAVLDPANNVYQLRSVNESRTQFRHFNVQLSSQPTDTVTINVASDDTNEVAVVTTPTPGQLTFTVANWNVPQTVEVQGVDDAVDDDDQLRHVVLLGPISNDPQYMALNPISISVINRDNDSAGFEVSKLAVATYEEGTTDSFTVQLTSQPTADVAVAVSSSDTTAATVSVASLTFTAATWNVPQTITVTGVDNLHIDVTDRTYDVVLGAAVSADPKYSGMSPTGGANVNGVDYQAGRSCLDLLTLMPTLTSGVYTLDTDLDGTASPRFRGFCDMETAVNGETGGWTLLSWTGDSEANGGVPYPGLDYHDSDSLVGIARSSSVPAGAIAALFQGSAEFAQGQAITTAGKAAITNFDVLNKYEFAGSFDYGTLGDITVGQPFTGCAGLKTGTYTTIKDPDSMTLNNGTVVFLNQNLDYADDATLSNFTSAASYAWSLGNKTGYCAQNGTAPASFLGTWQDGQYGPRYGNAAGAYSVWVR